MDLTEKDVEDMIWEASSSREGRAFLAERGLTISGTLFRQVNLGNYGVADLVSVSNRFTEFDGGRKHVHAWFIDVYELKRKSIGVEALGQSLRYRDAIERFLYDQYSKLPIQPLIYTHLIGSEIDFSKDFLSILRSCNHTELYEYSLAYDGIHFRKTNGFDYSRPDPGHPNARHFSHEALKAIAREKLIYDYRTE